MSVRSLGVAGEKTLDSGAIDPRSLAVHGSTATWTKDGTKHTATL